MSVRIRTTWNISPCERATEFDLRIHFSLSVAKRTWNTAMGSIDRPERCVLCRQYSGWYFVDGQGWTCYLCLDRPTTTAPAVPDAREDAVYLLGRWFAELGEEPPTWYGVGSRLPSRPLYIIASFLLEQLQA